MVLGTTEVSGASNPRSSKSPQRGTVPSPSQRLESVQREGIHQHQDDPSDVRD
ncbi:MAG: hypothetical protein HC806_00605 [Anaerolineae bacterium]|nr:hypothetical protein [Anaerolineae bacterium]